MSQATLAEMNGHVAAPVVHHEMVGHVVPVRVLIGVFVALIALTGVTVAVTLVDLGPLNLFVAMAIAAVKAAMVALWFMHLRYDSPFNALIFVAALGFLALFLGMTLMDAVAYQPDIQMFREATGP